MSETLVIFTRKTVDEIRDLGGTAWWKIDTKRARKAERIILCHNANFVYPDGTPDHTAEKDLHGKPFLVATLRGCKQDPRDKRWLIEFDKVAKIKSSDYAWKGYRNPCTYEQGVVDVTVGEWEDIAQADFDEVMAKRDAFRSPMTNTAETAGQIVQRYREKLAEELSVSPAQVVVEVKF